MNIDIGPQKQPKDENYWDMLKFNLCPRFSVYSITFLLTNINMIMFLILVGVSFKSLKDNEFLGISTQTLDTWGAKDAYKIRYNYQLWRWFTPIFLHANFMHIFFNTISLFWIGFMVESTIGKPAFTALYLLSGIGGFIFSCDINDDISVGASGAIFGLIGILLSNLILNWRSIMQSNYFISLIMIIVMIAVISVSGPSNVDIFGHFGGLFWGFIFGFVILKYNSNIGEFRKRFSYVGLVRHIISYFKAKYIIHKYKVFLYSAYFQS